MPIMKTFLKISALGLLAVALAGLPLSASGQTNDTSTNLTKAVTANKKKAAAPAKKPVAHPFHGNLAAADKIAKTITVGTSTYQITAETLLFKDGKPATFEDGVVGEPVSGYVKPGTDGKLNATKVTFGAKPDAKAAKSAAKKAAPKAASTPAPDAGTAK